MNLPKAHLRRLPEPVQWAGEQQDRRLRVHAGGAPRGAEEEAHGQDGQSAENDHVWDGDQFFEPGLLLPCHWAHPPDGRGIGWSV